MINKKLPVGIEFFDEMRREDFYYVDKTGLIVDLLANWGKVNLFTRPRRFGKTLDIRRSQKNKPSSDEKGGKTAGFDERIELHMF